MVYPVGNPYAYQQTPVTNTFQPGGTESVKKQEENKIADNTRPSGADAARSERVTNRNAEAAPRASEDERARDTGAVYSSASRGTSLDITI